MRIATRIRCTARDVTRGVQAPIGNACRIIIQGGSRGWGMRNNAVDTVPFSHG